MKKLLTVALLALSGFAFGATLTPIQLLNPSGSTSGQAIVSTGATTAPVWGSIPGASLAAQAANTVLANTTASSHSPTAFAMPSCSTSTSALQYTSGTGFTCGGSGFAALAGSAFSGAVSLSYVNPSFVLNDTPGTNQGSISWESAGGITWQMFGRSNGAGALFGLSRFNSGAFVDIPFQISNSTGAVTMSDGIINSPISGSTGSFTTLSTSGTATLNSVATGGATISGGSINGVPIGATTPSTGKFTTLQATSTITPSSTAGIVGTTTNDSANTGSVGEYVSANALAVSMTNATATNIASISLTAGDWDVDGQLQTVPAGTTVITTQAAGISSTSGTFQTINTGFFNRQTLNISGLAAGLGEQQSAPKTRISLATTTTIFLVGQANFTISTCAGNGFIQARRVR